MVIKKLSYDILNNSNKPKPLKPPLIIYNAKMNKDLSVHLGTSKGKPLYWNPKLEKNPHLITVGGSGSGKTETLKAIMLELKQQKINLSLNPKNSSKKYLHSFFSFLLTLRIENLFY